jgi:5'-nucleotidase
VVAHTVAPDPGISAEVEGYRRQIDRLAGRRITTLKQTFGRNGNQVGESAFGDLVADAQLAATRSPSEGGAQLAIVAHGFIRAGLERGPVSYAEIYTAQPFGHRLVTLSLTGRQLDTVLEGQFCDPAVIGPNDRMALAVSAGFSYRFDPSMPCGERIRLSDLRLGGSPIQADGRYRVTTNSLFASGGHGYPVFAAGTDRVTGGLDRDAVATYLAENPDLPAPALDRVQHR